MPTDSLHLVMALYRRIRTLEPRKTRWACTALSNLYGQLVIDYWGDRTHTDDPVDMIDALGHIERIVDALIDLTRLGVLTEHRAQIEPLLAQPIPTAASCDVIVTKLEALRAATEHKLQAEHDLKQKLAFRPPRISEQERQLNQDHAVQDARAAATGLEETSPASTRTTPRPVRPASNAATTPPTPDRSNSDP